MGPLSSYTRGMRVVLRDVEPRDFEAVLSLNEAAIPAVNAVDIDTLRWFAANAAYFRVAEPGATAADDARLLAFLIGLRPGTDYDSPNYRWFCEHYEDFGYIDRIAVSGQARRRGLASRLYADFERSLAADVRIMTCEVNLVPPNETSMQFHERLGFRQVGSQATEGGKKRVAMMERQL